MGDIGQRIRMLRESQGLTQDELAKKCGYKSRSSINKIELQRDAPIKKLIPIALALGITPEALLGWESEDETVNEIANTIMIHDEEQALLNAYRNADDLTKEMVKRLLNLK